MVSFDCQEYPGGSVNLGFFKEHFLTHCIGERYLQERCHEFQILEQGDMSIMDYEIEFIRLSRYVLGLVDNEDYPELAHTAQTSVQTLAHTQSIVHTLVGDRSQSRGSGSDSRGRPSYSKAPYFALFDPRTTRSYVSHSVYGFFDIPVGNIESHMIVLSLIGQYINILWIVKGCPIEIYMEIFLVDLMDLSLEEFDLILGMDWLDEHQLNIDCDTKRVVLKTLYNVRIVMIGEQCGFLINIILALVVKRMIKKGSKAFIAYILVTRGSRSEIERIQTVKGFPDVFPEELLSLPLDREFEFEIEVYSGSTPVSMASYHIAPKELKELKVQL
ncbi:uncharacterized protein LOC120115328 [Hibiscus syriacus]|uniref:uncharacterized protein LOC120115328 n=1 Tax=Hibiscus syriacus TaxID=106335 RepID=UPI001923D900|nr:uncharacterized protein LOC120115328 [Hibiscus syriacus]